MAPTGGLQSEELMNGGQCTDADAQTVRAVCQVVEIGCVMSKLDRMVRRKQMSK